MSTFTIVHVVISLVGIASGLLVAYGMLAGKQLNILTALFLASTVATSVTGFFFPFHGFKPAYAVGIISLIVLTVAIVARYSYRLAGGWRVAYVVSAILALYLNCFVLIVQSFLKVPSLHVLAPTQAEAPFKIAQLVALVLFVILGVAAAKKFRVEPVL